MKKKMLLPVVICLVILIIVLVLVFGKSGDNKYTTITLDINPSIEIKLDNDIVKEIKALNDDGKKVIEDLDDDLKLEDAIKEIMNKTIELDYLKSDTAVVLVYVDGQLDMDELEKYINGPLSEQHYGLNMIVVDKITKEDEAIAKKYDITLAKAHLLNELAKERNVKVEDYVNKSISEIKETKDTGYKCEEGYELRDSLCFKEIAREEAKSGKVCPRGYLDYNGKCYEETGSEESDNLICAEGRFLRDGKCIYVEEREAQPKSFACPNGTLTKKSEAGIPGDGYTCADMSKATHPMSPCELHDGTETIMYGGKCYWHRAGVLPGGCPGKDIQIGRFCWDDASNVLVCKGARDGKQYSSKNDYCEGSVKYTEPTISEYTCESEFSLSGTKCVKETEEEAQHERVCPSGYTKVEGDRCINMDKITDSEDGYVCDKENTEVHGKECITYEIVPVSK